MSGNYGSRFETMESAFVSNEDASLFVQLAQAYRDAGDFDRAFRILRRGIEQHPGHGPGYELLGRTLLDRGRVAEAAFCFERLLEVAPSNPIARAALDDIARRLREAPVTRATTIGAPASAPAAFTPPPASPAPAPVSAAPLAPAAPPRPPSLSAPPLWPQNAAPPPNLSAPVRPASASESVVPPPLSRTPPIRPPFVAAPEEAAPPPPPLPPPPPAAPEPPALDAREEWMPWEAEPASKGNGAGTAAPIETPQAPVLPPEPSPEVVALEASLKQGQAQQAAAVVEPVRSGADSTAVELSDLLVGLVEYRDPFFRGNTSLTRLLTTAMARDLKLNDQDVNAIALGAVLRDVGQFPLRNMLNRPGMELPAGARKNMERHVDTALEMMAGITLPDVTRDTIRYHHERWDGAGYPDGRKGDAIPLGARIVAVADSFSAMISARPHRLPKRVPAALEEIRAGAGAQYDARVVDSLVRVVNATHWKGPGFSLRHHVLIVDPDETRAMVVATRLCSHGYLAEATFNVAAAQDRLEKSHIVALIISSDMPAEEESSLLHQVRDTPRIAMIPVIITDAGVNERVPLLEMGADVCLNRGSSFEELKATLEAFLRREGKAIPQSSAKTPEAGWSRLRGDIHDFPLNWLLQVLHYDSRTAAIFIVGASDEGVIYLDRGSPRHAQTRFLAGEEAFRNMLEWKTGSFSVDPEARTDMQTIRISLMNLLLETAVREDNASFFGQVQT